MKNIKNYDADKYLNSTYKMVENGIFQRNDLFVTSLSFQQEPDFDEGSNAGEISQYPLDDILDRFYVHVSDFYKNENLKNSVVCYLEFASPDIEDIRKLRTIIGKHVFNQEYTENGKSYVKLVIE